MIGIIGVVFVMIILGLVIFNMIDQLLLDGYLNEWIKDSIISRLDKWRGKE